MYLMMIVGNAIAHLTDEVYSDTFEYKRYYNIDCPDIIAFKSAASPDECASGCDANRECFGLLNPSLSRPKPCKLKNLDL